MDGFEIFIPFLLEIIMQVITGIIENEKKVKGKRKGKLKKKMVMDAMDLAIEGGIIKLPSGLKYVLVRPFLGKLVDRSVKLFNKMGIF